MRYYFVVFIIFTFFHRVLCSKIYPVPDYCLRTPKPGRQFTQRLAATPQTVHWGYVYDGLKPALTINSGERIFVEMVSHHASDDFDKMIKGDKNLEDIYRLNEQQQTIHTRGANGRSDGVHILTGPIYVCGAEPGDVLQVDILNLKPRQNPQGRSFGSNAAAWFGFHQRVGFFSGMQGREVVTIYEVLLDSKGRATHAIPDYQFGWMTDEFPGPMTACVPTQGETPRTVPGREYTWNNPTRFYAGAPGNGSIPCVDGKQTWSGIYYTGVIVQHPTGTEDFSIRGKFQIPTRLHIGNMGLAPDFDVPVNSIMPTIQGGNIDNRRISQGVTMYYPVQVQGALLSMGDAHGAQGDGEIDGTALELSVNGRFRVTLRKKNELPRYLKDLHFPLLEDKNQFNVHGFTYKDYLNELEGDPQVEIFALSSVDRALEVALNNTKKFMIHAFELTEDQAITAITLAVDFTITQVVDGNWGVHAIIPKSIAGKRTGLSFQ